MTVDVHLRDTLNGVTDVYTQEYDPDFPLDVIEYMWTEGNYSCDCNRYAFLHGHDEKHKCGDGRIDLDRIVIRETGHVLYEKLRNEDE